jgi:hypothetical protein
MRSVPYRSLLGVALLRHGADIEMTDQDGDASVDHAREREQTHIAALLESWSGEP